MRYQMCQQRHYKSKTVFKFHDWFIKKPCKVNYHKGLIQPRGGCPSCCPYKQTKNYGFILLYFGLFFVPKRLQIREFNFFLLFWNQWNNFGACPSFQQELFLIRTTQQVRGAEAHIIRNKCVQSSNQYNQCDLISENEHMLQL